MEQIIEEIQQIIINARKSKGRKYSKETIIQKIERINELGKKFSALVANLTDPIRENKIQEFKELRNTALELLKDHSTIASKNTNPIMSNFNSKQASDTIPIFDGKSKHLEVFLSMVELVSSELNEQGQINLIKYVTAMKLSERVRNVLITEDLPTTLTELKSALTKNFKPTKTASILHSEIRSIRQKGSVENYKEKISSLIAELTIIQITDLGTNSNEIARSTIRVMNERLSLDIFQEGLYEGIRTAVVAAQPKTLTQAYEIACTQERLLKITDNINVLHINRSYNRKERRYNNNGNNRGFSNNNTNRQRQNSNMQFNRHNISNNNRNNSYNNNNSFNNRNNRGNNYNNYNNSTERSNRNGNFNRNNNNNTNSNSNNRNNNNYNNRNNSQHNVYSIEEQGNIQSLEIRDDSPRREN